MHVLEVDTNQSFCDDDDATSGWMMKIDGDEAMRYRVEYYLNHFSGYEKAEVYSLQKVKFASLSFWKLSDAELTSKIKATRRTIACNVDDLETETKNCFNCDYSRARVNTGWNTFDIRHCTGDVIGTFEKNIGQSTINATEVLDFECCIR